MRNDHGGIPGLSRACGRKFDKPHEDQVETHLVIVVGGIHKDDNSSKDSNGVTYPTILGVKCFCLDQRPSFARLSSVLHLLGCRYFLFFNEVLPLLVLDLLVKCGCIRVYWRSGGNLYEGNLTIVNGKELFSLVLSSDTTLGPFVEVTDKVGFRGYRE